MKKTLITLILLCCVFTSFNEVLAINSEKDKRKKEVKIEETENKFDYINMEWWNNFQDPYLTDYINRAIMYNHNLKIATISTKEYYQMVKMQFANQLPSASIGFAPAYAKLPNSSSSHGYFALPALANYEIDLFLKNRDKTKSIRKNYEMSLLDERSAYILTASIVGTTYLNLVKLDKLIEIQNNIVEKRKTIFDLMSKRNKQGITSTADTMRANKAYISAVTQLNELEKERDSLLNMFCTLIGESSNNAGEIARINYDNINFKGQIPDSISSEIIEQRPDYMKAVKEIEKAGIDVRVAKKEFLPTFNISGLALFNSTQIGKLFNTTNALTAVGGLVGLDLFQGGRKIANLKLKKAAYERIMEQYEQTNLTAMQEINDSLLFIKKDSEKLNNTIAQEVLEKRDNNFYKKRYEKGVISKLDLAQSDENLLTIEQRLVNQKTDCFIDYIGLYKATGSKL